MDHPGVFVSNATDTIIHNVTCRYSPPWQLPAGGIYRYFGLFSWYIASQIRYTRFFLITDELLIGVTLFAFGYLKNTFGSDNGILLFYKVESLLSHNGKRN